MLQSWLYLLGICLPVFLSRIVASFMCGLEIFIKWSHSSSVKKFPYLQEDEQSQGTSASFHAMTRAELNLAALSYVWAFSLLTEAAGHSYRKARGLQLRCSICSDGEPSASLYLHAVDTQVSSLLWPRWIRAVK